MTLGGFGILKWSRYQCVRYTRLGCIDDMKTIMRYWLLFSTRLLSYTGPSAGLGWKTRYIRTVGERAGERTEVFTEYHKTTSRERD